MRTRRLCELTLAVLAAHALALQLAAGGRPTLALAPPGVQRVALVDVARPAPVAGTPPPAVNEPARRPAPGRARNSARTSASRLAHAPAAARARVPPGQRAPAGDHGAAPGAARDAHAWPVYATRVPPSVTLRYAIVQAGAAASAAGAARLEWRRDADTFSLRLAATLDGRPPREWQSTGGFDAAGLAPVRLVERDKGHDRRAVTFERGGGTARLSSAPGAPALAAGAQDRWSWIAQLAAIVEAGARHGERPRQWDLQVAGLRGELERWTFRVLPPGDPPPQLRPPGRPLSAGADRAPALLHVLRATDQPYDLRIEAWLSPSLHHLPAGLRMSTPPGPWSLSLWQRNP